MCFSSVYHFVLSVVCWLFIQSLQILRCHEKESCITKRYFSEEIDITLYVHAVTCLILYYMVPLNGKFCV
jgi:hypothetical protein